MADLIKELNSLDFSNYIGGPLQAAVVAQTQASLATVDFIKQVGLDENKNLVYVDFKYKKTTIGTNGEPIEEDYTLSVPFISIVIIPSLRIDEITIDFSAKLTSVETANTETQFDVSASLTFNYLRMVRLQASASYRSKTSTGSEVNRAYDLNVHVSAVNDELPAGLDRVLRILESEIKNEKGTISNGNGNGN
jgi:hypothetical protein